jgi:hypothetical protein
MHQRFSPGILNYKIIVLIGVSFLIGYHQQFREANILH